MPFAGPSRLSSIAIQPLKTATRTPRSLVQQRFASNSRVLQNGVRPPSSPPLSKNLSKRPEGTVEAVSEDSRSVTEARLAVEDKFRRRVGRSAAKPPQRTSRLLAYIGWGGSIMAAFWMILYEDFGPNEHVFSPFRRVYSQITDAVLGVTPYEKSTLGFQYASIPNRSKAETDLSDEDGEAYIRSLEEEFVKPAREKLMQEQAQYK